MLKFHQLGGNPYYNTFIKGVRVETRFYIKHNKVRINVDTTPGSAEYFEIYDLAVKDRLEYLKSCIKHFKLIDMSRSY